MQRMQAGCAGDRVSTPRTWVIELPPGLDLLNPNHRSHWADRHRRSQALRKATWAKALQAKIPPLAKVTIAIEYQPPDLRHRDADNGPAASVKPCTDGLVAAKILDGDDERYVKSVTSRIGSLYPGGRLILTITELGGNGETQ
jgi:hypothetical protein